ncbi:K+-transporting ATPase, C subunit [Nocardioidaceae bacterium Broad-1]|nr:K+-transporting ATPase, C subunit [Nocardioidaceae bacterium Broad-1]
MNDIYALLRHSWAGLRVLLAATLLLGLGYPLLVTGVAQVAFPWQANGSLVTAEGSRTTDPSEAAGSALLGQVSDDSALFYPRPSAAGDGYDTMSSYGSNLGPEEPALIDAIKERKAEIAAREGVPADEVPADAVTASGSGLDPHISPAYASLQVARVAEANDLPEAKVRELVEESTEGRTWGVLGEARVNVLLLNIAVKQAAH